MTQPSTELSVPFSTRTSSGEYGGRRHREVLDEAASNRVVGGAPVAAPTVPATPLFPLFPCGSAQ